MNNWLYIILSVFLCVVLITGFIIPQILLIAFRKELFDEVDQRKLHKGTVPRLGGIAFFPSILFSVLLVCGISSLFIDEPTLYIFTNNFRQFCLITSGLVILFLTGIADDLIGVRYIAKFIFQTFAASLMVIGGIWLDNLHGFLGISQMPIFPTILLTLLVTVFITNAINLIDGIDGLASGLGAVACGYYGVIYYLLDHYFYSMLAFATLGALLPFFYYNVAGNPEKHKKIFMGDTGALTIGFILSVLSIRICMMESIPDDLNPGVIAFAPMLIPCFDVVRVYLRRIRHHNNPFLPDKTHIHHKLLALGLRQRIAMPAIILSSAFLTIFNYLICPFLNITILFAIDLLIWIGINILLTKLIRNREARLNTTLYE